MDRSHVIILLVITVALIQGIDLATTLRTGRAHGRWHGTMTREKQPRRFWRYVYSAWAVLILCAAVTVWALISPESLNR